MTVCLRLRHRRIDLACGSECAHVAVAIIVSYLCARSQGAKEDAEEHGGEATAATSSGANARGEVLLWAERGRR